MAVALHCASSRLMTRRESPMSRSARCSLLLVVLLSTLLSWASNGLAQTAAPAADAVLAQAQSIVHMLDYIAVDYPQFVRDGVVVDEQEYAEQREFAGQVSALLAGMS
ncbi:MAG: hypothetical protein AB7L76_25785, partial [Burkholderiaceae bacterium]